VSGRSIAGVLLGLSFAAGALLIVSAATGPRIRTRRRQGVLARLASRGGPATLTPSTIVAACFVTAVGAGILALLVTALPLVAGLAAVAGGLAPIIVLRRRATARATQLRAAWPDAVDVLVSAVRAGMSLPEAVADLARTGPAALRPAFHGFAVEYRATGSFTTAVDLLQDRLDDPVADRVVAALRLARDVGGTELGTTLRTLSAMLRDDARTRSEILARQSWTVAAARMAVAAPWLTLALLCTRPEAATAYSSAAGAVVLTTAALLSVVAYLVMMRIGRLPGDERARS
jgi:tight adherence protein B